MNLKVPEKFLKFGLVALFGVFLFVGIFGLVLSGTKKFHLNIAACSAVQQGVCQNPAQHVSGWQNMFNALESDAFSSSAVLAFGLQALYRLVGKIYTFFLVFVSLSRYRHLTLRYRLFSEINLALSSGILQPAR